MSSYEKWIEEEIKWIDVYCSKTRRKYFRVTMPLTLAGCVMVVVIALLINGNISELAYGVFGAFLMAAFICGIQLLILLPGLNSKRYGRKIEKNVRALSLNDMEKEQLAEEMLAADEEHKISYTVCAPGSKGTPGRFVLTPHYAFLEGSSPYSILVRLPDIAKISRGQEKKTVTRRNSSRSSTIYRFTLYTIGFYRKDRFQRNLTEKDLPDEAFGFFDVGIRERVMGLLGETGIHME